MMSLKYGVVSNATLAKALQRNFEVVFKRMSLQLSIDGFAQSQALFPSRPLTLGFRFAFAAPRNHVTS